MRREKRRQGVELGREGGAEPSVGKVEARVGRALEAAVAVGTNLRISSISLPECFGSDCCN